MLAGEDAVVEAFGRLGLPASVVPTSKTGIREAVILGRTLRTYSVDVLVVDRPRDLRLGGLSTVYHPLTLINRYNLSRWQPPRDLISRLVYQRVALTVFLSHTTAERVLHMAAYIRRKPYRIIRGAVDTEHFRSLPALSSTFRTSYGLGDRPILLAVGSLTRDKRYDFLFEMMAALADAAPVLVVCGDGPLRDELRGKARAQGIDVRFLGAVSPDVLLAAYNSATCLVHACAIETFGLSVLEAMACGLPVVGVRAGAVPEVLGESGLLAPPDDPHEFATLVRVLLTDPTLRGRLGHAGQSRATTVFSFQEMRKSYCEAIELASRSQHAPSS
jgi:glycosyltransferase involved in cell wall biosynthesis